jgi:hypothetical protein
VDFLFSSFGSCVSAAAMQLNLSCFRWINELESRLERLPGPHSYAQAADSRITWVEHMYIGKYSCN